MLIFAPNIHIVLLKTFFTMKKYLFLMLMMAFACVGTADAQGWLGKLKDKAVEKIKEKVEKKVEEKTEEIVDGVLDGEDGSNAGNVSDENAAEENPSANTSTDFKRGGTIMFEDDVKGELVGEFPSKWDLLSGKAETKTLGGVKAIEVTDDGTITPLIEEQGAYLPEEFTLEYEFYYWKTKEDIGLNDLKLILANTTDRSESPDYMGESNAFSLVHAVCDNDTHGYYYNGNKEGSFKYKFKQGWHKVALSFNKRALKVYMDGNRVVNLPRVNQPKWFCFQVPFDYKDLTFIRNVVMAKGAVALYDRNAQSMTAVEKAIAETGKFVTNNILFETGKATLKQESMEEIQKVADYMKKNPTVRFEVQGHTDNQGSDKVNDPLSQKRAEAVVKALEALGCDGFNLRAVGKGSHEPVADNGTEAGRAKNRRVEFIKK